MHVFIDESGDHNLKQSTSDNLYNAFVLAAVCFKDDSSYHQFDEELKNLKEKLFGNREYHLHTAEINRPGKASDSLTHKFFNSDFRAEFYSEMNSLIKRTSIKIISAAVKKDEVSELPEDSQNDPYLFTFDFILNQVLILCGPRRTCKIYPEKRTHTENNKVDIAFIRAKNSGTKFFKGSEVAGRIEEFMLKDKKDNLSGLQLADLIVTPIGRHILGKAPKPDGNEIHYSTVKEKISARDFLIYP